MASSSTGSGGINSSSSGGGGAESKLPAVHIDVPPRMLTLTVSAMLLGMFIGGRRDGRMEGMRFLAENAHRAPTTVRGWYLYSKTKNYRMMLAGLRGAGREACKLGFVAFGWATIEEGLERIGWGDLKEVGAGLGTAALFAGVYRLPARTTYRVGMLGLMVGTAMRGLRWVQEEGKRVERVEREREGAEGGGERKVQ